MQDTHAVAGLIVQNAADARMQNIPSAGHLVNLAAPETFNSMLLEFLDSL